MIEKKVVGVLLANNTVKALIGNTRIYPVVVRVDSVLPCITYMRQSGDREYSLAGAAGWARANIGLMAWARDYSVARDIADAIRKALDTYGDTTSGGIRVASVTDGADSYDADADVFGCALDVIVQWEET